MKTKSASHSLTVAAIIGLSAAPCLAAGARPLCEGVATHLRALPAADTDLAPVGRLAAAPNPYVQLDDAKQLTVDAVTALPAMLQQQYHAAPEVLVAVAALQPEQADEVWLHGMGASSVHAIEVQAGTLDCSDFVFFAAPAGAAGRLIANPPQYQSRIDSGQEPYSFCYNDQGILGAVGGQPAFIEQIAARTAPDYQIIVSAWSDPASGKGTWDKPCEVDVRYKPAYAVGEIHCRGAACKALPAAAVDMASRREAQSPPFSDDNLPANFAWGPKPSAAAVARFNQIAALIGPAQGVPVPTLGAKGAMDESFGDDSVIFPVELAGQTYAAVLSHQWIGWRTFPTYLLGLYDEKAGAPEPVAGLKIDQRQGGVASIRVKAWQPPKAAGVGG
jgi:hypothetical protein